MKRQITVTNIPSMHELSRYINSTFRKDKFYEMLTSAWINYKELNKENEYYLKKEGKVK